MGLFEEPFLRHGSRGFDSPVPGLVRMDRAMLYLRQRLRSVIGEVEARSTKTIGDTGYYRVMAFGREAVSLCSMSGDRDLYVLIRGATSSLGTRTPRRDALAALKELLARLEAHEPPDDLAGFEEFRDRGARFDDATGDATPTKVTDQQLTDERSVFVIMPFAADFSDVWKGGIQRAAQAEGFNPIRVDMINRSTNITDDIVASIEKCRLAIVDVTKNNPNVMFELGYAIAKGKKNIIISQSADFLPFDIRNIRTIVYANTWSGVEELKTRVQEFLNEYAPAKHGKRGAK